jgi:hypothetical protein
MSDAHKDDEAPPGTAQLGDMQAGNGKEADIKEVMGDIGNPPRGNFTQISVVEKEENYKESSPTPTPTPTPPPSSTPPSSYPAESIGMEPRRSSSPTPPPSNNNEDGESVESESTGSSTMESSPAPMKRSMVLSGREHEETDDFLLSTMLAIRTAVRSCHLSRSPFVYYHILPPTFTFTHSLLFSHIIIRFSFLLIIVSLIHV